jgi:hypothetical protein
MTVFVANPRHHIPCRHSGQPAGLNPESITTMVRMDSGLALSRAPE